MNAYTLEQARAAKPHAAEIFGRLVRVASVGITRIDSGYGVKVNLSEQPPADVNLPADIDGVPVCVEVVGRVRKL